MTRKSSTISADAGRVLLYDPPPTGYYSHDFVVNGIRQSSRIIRIWCLRNTRITEPDIRDQFERFIRERGGRVEILALHPNNPDVILDSARVLLANPVNNVAEFREDIDKNCAHVRRLWRDLGSLSEHYSYYEYCCLPLIHLCQFDDFLYLGLQYLKRRNEPGSLDRLCIRTHAESDLGRRLLAEFEYVRSQLSAEYRHDRRYLDLSGVAPQESPAAPRTLVLPDRRVRVSQVDRDIRIAIKRVVAGEPLTTDNGYIAAFTTSGERKAEEFVRATSKVIFDPRRAAILSVGGADGSELFGIIKNIGIRYGALLEWDNNATSLARAKAEEFRRRGHLINVYEGDATQKVGEAQKWLSGVRRDRGVDTLCCSINALLHELPDRGAKFQLNSFLHSLVGKWDRVLLTIREPVRPQGWPRRVDMKIPGVRPETLTALANYVAQRRNFKGSVDQRAAGYISLPSRLAGEVLFKVFYRKELDYELQESVTSFSATVLRNALDEEFGPHNVDEAHMNSDSFNRLYDELKVEARDPRTGGALRKPIMFSGFVAFRGLERR